MYKRVWNTALTSNTTTAEEELGVVREEYDTTSRYRAFVYVQAASGTTVANGTALAYSDTDRVTATSNFSDANVNQVAGVGIGAITASSYGWIQIRGYHSAVLTNGDKSIVSLIKKFIGLVVDYMRETPSISNYQRVKMFECGQSAGKKNIFANNLAL